MSGSGQEPDLQVKLTVAQRAVASEEAVSGTRRTLWRIFQFAEAGFELGIAGREPQGLLDKGDGFGDASFRRQELTQFKAGGYGAGLDLQRLLY